MKAFFNLKNILIVILCVFSFYTTYQLYDIKLQEQARVPYTVNWTFQPGEILELNPDILVIDVNKIILTPTATLANGNVTYQLPTGEYTVIYTTSMQPERCTADLIYLHQK